MGFMDGFDTNLDARMMIPEKATGILDGLIEALQQVSGDFPYHQYEIKDVAMAYLEKHPFANYNSVVEILDSLVKVYNKESANYIKELNTATQISMDLGVKAAEIAYKDSFPAEPE